LQLILSLTHHHHHHHHHPSYLVSLTPILSILTYNVTTIQLIDQTTLAWHTLKTHTHTHKRHDNLITK
jgi:hypothetical protein